MACAYSASFRLLSASWPPRSSHSVTVLAPSHAIIFGGEVQSREPVPSSINAFALTPNSSRALNLGVQGDVPAPRVGATLVQDRETYYVWGGRGGKDVAPLEGTDAGVYAFTVSEAITHWRSLASTGDVPAGRSYHSAAVLGGKMYIHAGCPVSGRLSDLYALDLKANAWTRLSGAPAEARGGTTLVPTHINIEGAKQDALLRWGGFAGFQLGAGNELDIYLPAMDCWKTVHPSTPDGAPGPRSVHGFAAVDISGDGERLVAVMFLGEREESGVGHASAGAFWDDVWGLAQRGETFIWRKLDIQGKSPSARGWIAYTTVESGSSERGRISRILIHGGLLPSNERSGEAYVLEVTRHT